MKKTRRAPETPWQRYNRLLELRSTDSPKPVNVATEKTVGILVSGWPDDSHPISLKLTNDQYERLMEKPSLIEALGYLGEVSPDYINSIYKAIFGIHICTHMAVFKAEPDEKPEHKGKGWRIAGGGMRGSFRPSVTELTRSTDSPKPVNVATPADNSIPTNVAAPIDNPSPTNVATEKKVGILVSSWPYISHAVSLELTESQYKNLMEKRLLSEALSYLGELAPRHVRSIDNAIFGKRSSTGMVVIRVKPDGNLEDTGTAWRMAGTRTSDTVTQVSIRT